MGSLSEISPLFHQIVTLLAIGFLIVYGLLAFRRAIQSSGSLLSTVADGAPNKGQWYAIVTTLAMSLLNPHVYLDTVVVVGGFASNLIFMEKIRFITGALCASFLWFFGLAYATPYLLAGLKTPKSAAYFDYFVAAVMWALAAQLLYALLRHP